MGGSYVRSTGPARSADAEMSRPRTTPPARVVADRARGRVDGARGRRARVPVASMSGAATPAPADLDGPRTDTSRCDGARRPRPGEWPRSAAGPAPFRATSESRARPRPVPATGCPAIPVHEPSHSAYSRSRRERPVDERREGRVGTVNPAATSDGSHGRTTTARAAELSDKLSYNLFHNLFHNLLHNLAQSAIAFGGVVRT
jgi:hypothetical protein